MFTFPFKNHFLPNVLAEAGSFFLTSGVLIEHALHGCWFSLLAFSIFFFLSFFLFSLSSLFSLP
jgi:hypothetical protein